MEKNNNSSSINNHHQNREQRGGGGGVFNGNSGDNNNLVRTNTHPPETRSNNNNNHNNLASTTTTTTTSSDFVLQWGNKKRLRCMKVQSKDREGSSSATARFDRRPVVRSDLLINGSKDNNNAFLNLRHSPSHRVTRNSEGTVAMKGGQSNGASDKRANGAHHNTAATTTTTANTNHNSNNNNHNHHINNNNNVNNGGVGSGSGSDTVHDSKKCGTSSGSDAMPAVWPPKFVIGLTNKEKEEDFYAFKGSKLPQRPKKRAKFIQRTLNLVSPGAWLCDLTLERYEVREKKISKKRPRGLKAMGNMESDSE